MIVLPLSEPAVAFIAYNARKQDRDELSATMPAYDSEALAEGAMRSGYGFIGATRDGVPVAAVGAVPCWPGVWQVWMFATAAWPEVALGTTRHVKRWLVPSVTGHPGFHRGHAFSSAHHTEAHRWLELLGAEYETRLTAWGRGREDFLVYVWRR